jgi:hypothetical protein
MAEAGNGALGQRDHRVDADRETQLNRHGIPGSRQCLSQRERAQELVIRVLGLVRTPVIQRDGQCRVVHDGVRRNAVGDGRGIDDGFERRPRLPKSGERAIVRRVLVVAAADQCPNLSGRRVDRDQQSLQIVFRCSVLGVRVAGAIFDGFRAITDRTDSRPLQPGIERRIQPIASRVDRDPRMLGLGAHRIDEIRSETVYVRIDN